MDDLPPPLSLHGVQVCFQIQTTRGMIYLLPLLWQLNRLIFCHSVICNASVADECGWLFTNYWDDFQKHELHIFVHRMWDCKAEMHISFSLELEYLASLFQAKMVCTKTVHFFSFFIIQYKNSKRTVETWAASGSYCLHTLASMVTQHHCPLNSWHQTSCCSTYLYFQPSAI